MEQDAFARYCAAQGALARYGTAKQGALAGNFAAQGISEGYEQGTLSKYVT